MKPCRIMWIQVFCVILAILSGLEGCARKPIEGSKPLRLGWQPPWANQGQLVEVLKHTDVLARNGVAIDYKAFTYGGPMTEAALAGEVDILFVGNQPAITLISREPEWRIVARMVNYRSAIIVPPGSALKSVDDLSGRKVLATAFGSTTHRDAVQRLREVGLDIDRDIRIVNVDQAEHAALISRGGSLTWGDVSAIATYDPTVAVAVQGNRARVLKEWVSTAVVLARRDFIQTRADDLRGFLRAYIEAFSIYAREPSRFDMLYNEDSRLPLPPSVYGVMSAVEPNLSAQVVTAVNVLLDPAQQDALQKNADVALEIGIISRRVDVRTAIDLHLAEEAMAQAIAKQSTSAPRTISTAVEAERKSGLNRSHATGQRRENRR